MNLGKVAEKIEKKIHLLKTLTWIVRKKIIKALSVTIHRDIEHVEKINIVIEASVH